MLENVKRLEDRAVRYLTNNLERFEPLAWTDRRKTETFRKSFIELGLYDYVRRLAGDPHEEIHDHIVERVNDRRYAELFDRYPKLFRSYALPAVTLRQSGELDERTAAAVDRVLRGDAVWGVERPPNSTLDMLFESQLWGYDDHGYDIETVVSQSAAAHPPHPIRATFEEYYTLTHAVFIPTNLGWGHERLPDPPLPYDLETTVTAGLLRGVAADHSDLVVELLWTGAIQDQLHPTVFEHAVEWLVSDRSEPERVFPPDIDAAQAGEGFAVTPDDGDATWEGDERHWLDHYHVNAVTACTCRYLTDRVDLAAYDSDTVSTDSETFEALVQLGTVLQSLHDYRLETAAEQICAVDERWFREFDGITERILSFFETQDHGEGFGHWPDERRLFELEHGTSEEFQAELVDPIVPTCREAVTHLEQAVRVENA